jgi:hypothetical protein
LVRRAIRRDESTISCGPTATTEIDHLSMRRTKSDRNEPYRGGHGHRARTRPTQFSRLQMSLRLSPLTPRARMPPLTPGHARMLVLLQPECKRDIDALRQDRPGRCLDRGFNETA